MQMFGVGILELLVILVLAVIVVGPDRMPQLAADMARWIRQARSYARYMMRDFNEVVGELQKEANVSQEDWKEITSIVSRNTGELGKELQRAARDAEQAGDLALAKANEPAASKANGNSTNGANGAAAAEAETQEEETAEEGTAEEKPWYEPEKRPRTRRRRSSE